MPAIRNAPAVCEEEGPTIMGPTISLMLIGFMCALLAWLVETHQRACARLRPCLFLNIRIAAEPTRHSQKHSF